jgi:GxxExxY protein
MKKRVEIPEDWNRITEAVIGCALAVHRELGPGLAEVLYERALDIELGEQGVPFDRQHRCVVTYKGRRIGDQVLDLVVDGIVVVELKSVETVGNQHLAQLTGYLRGVDLPLGLLINFNTLRLIDGVHRRLNQHSTKFLPSVPSAYSAPSAAPRTVAPGAQT